MSDDSNDARKTAETVTRREKRRIRSLAFLSIALWVCGCLMITIMLLPLAAKIKQQVIILQSASSTQPTTALNGLPRLVHDGAIVTMMMIGIAMLTALLASICTVTLSLTIRRVTLRQVSQSLTEISEQLRQLQRQQS